jgi:hypothetical protein
MPRGAATAPAIAPPVVARKFLRVGESGPEEFDIEFLNPEFKNGTLYAHVGRLRQARISAAKN